MQQTWLACTQESLGGNAKTSLVIAVANAVQHSEETLQSLQFGSRAMRVQTQAVVNECLDFKVHPALQALLSHSTALRLHLVSSRVDIQCCKASTHTSNIGVACKGLGTNSCRRFLRQSQHQ